MPEAADPNNPQSMNNPETRGRAQAILALCLGLSSMPCALVVGLGILPGIAALAIGSRVNARGGAGRPLALIGMSSGLLGTLASSLVLLILFTSIILPRLELGAAKANVGREVAFTFTTVAGETLDSKALDGERVVLDMWATWCGPCIATIPALDRLAREEGVRVIGVTFEDPDQVADWLRARRARGEGPHYPVVAGSRSSLGVPVFASVDALPTLFILDGNQTIQEILIGSHTYENLRAAVLAVPLTTSTPAASSDSTSTPASPTEGTPDP